MSRSPSRCRRATNCNPTGAPPSVKPAGKLTAGCPLRLKAQVNATLITCPGPACPCGGLGVVGVARRSTPLKTSSNRRSFSARIPVWHRPRAPTSASALAPQPRSSPPHGARPRPAPDRATPPPPGPRRARQLRPSSPARPGRSPRSPARCPRTRGQPTSSPEADLCLGHVSPAAPAQQATPQILNLTSQHTSNPKPTGIHRRHRPVRRLQPQHPTPGRRNPHRPSPITAGRQRHHPGRHSNRRPRRRPTRHQRAIPRIQRRPAIGPTPGLPRGPRPWHSRRTNRHSTSRDQPLNLLSHPLDPHRHPKKQLLSTTPPATSRSISRAAARARSGHTSRNARTRPSSSPIRSKRRLDHLDRRQLTRRNGSPDRHRGQLLVLLTCHWHPSGDARPDRPTIHSRTAPRPVRPVVHRRRSGATLSFPQVLAELSGMDSTFGRLYLETAVSRA